MLFFIILGLTSAQMSYSFKYISCYSLSLPYTRINGGLPHSNTSHVILYPGRTMDRNQPVQQFKYISCYSLSGYFCRLPSQQLKFKYISCYSLSLNGLFANLPIFHSNTSHVILYPTHFRLFLHYYTSNLLIFQYFIIFYQP